MITFAVDAQQQRPTKYHQPYLSSLSAEAAGTGILDAVSQFAQTTLGEPAEENLQTFQLNAAQIGARPSSRELAALIVEEILTRIQGISPVLLGEHEAAYDAIRDTIEKAARIDDLYEWESVLHRRFLAALAAFPEGTLAALDVAAREQDLDLDSRRQLVIFAGHVSDRVLHPAIEVVLQSLLGSEEQDIRDAATEAIETIKSPYGLS